MFGFSGDKKRKINVVSLGCSKNLVESEAVMAQLEAAGFHVVHNSPKLRADAVLIKTCGFIGDAKEESVNTILYYADAKRRGKIGRLFVMGCLSERYRDDLIEEIPEVDEYFGARSLQEVVEALCGSYRTELIGERVLTTPSHYAYLKVSEGCNWGCSYCAIPLIRGPHRSRPQEEIVREAESLARKGVKELILIAQDLTYYGKDLYGERRLAELLRKLCRIEGIEWIRLHYTYPAHFPMDVIDVMAEEPKICKYLDIPFQHVSDRTLASMRRGITGAETQQLIDTIREKVPGIALRTTLIVGYPTETEEQFEELMEFVRRNRFDRLGVFPYSHEEGTHAGETLADSIPQQEKERRVDAVMSLQARISEENNENRKGEEIRVIIDRLEDRYYSGRSEYDSPEVDQEVLICADDVRLEIGSFCRVKIVKTDNYDLFGVPVGEQEK